MRVGRSPVLFATTFLLALGACSDRTPTGPSMLGPSLDVTTGVTRWVAQNGGADKGDCTASPCLTINYAISQANAGDVVSVGPGTYKETVQIGKRLTVTGHDAVIDASGQSSPPNGVVISGPWAEGTVFTGFTVRNAGLEGILVLQTARITISHNVVVKNDAYGPFNPLCVAQPDDCGEAIHLQSVVNSHVEWNRVHDNIGGILLTDENGPTHGNTIANNVVVENTIDCGITLASHWFDPNAAAAPNVAGVYDNTVTMNTSNRNGAAGIGVFAGPPGAAAWGNVVTNNTVMNNGAGGIMVHSHTPAQYVNKNVIDGNTISGNGTDTDNPVDDGPAGISIFSAVVPIPVETVSHNSVANEKYGIVTYNVVSVQGLGTNTFAGSVAVPISMH